MSREKTTKHTNGCLKEGHCLILQNDDQMLEQSDSSKDTTSNIAAKLNYSKPLPIENSISSSKYLVKA